MNTRGSGPSNAVDAARATKQKETPDGKTRAKKCRTKRFCSNGRRGRCLSANWDSFHHRYVEGIRRPEHQSRRKLSSVYSNCQKQEAKLSFWYTSYVLINLRVLLRPSYPSSPEFQSSEAPDVASTSCVLWSVYISLGVSAPVNSCLCCSPVLTFFSSKFLGSGAASSAFPRFGELLWEFLYKRKAMKDRRATRRVPNEMPTPIPIFAD